jgi:hypothetical protein
MRVRRAPETHSQKEARATTFRTLLSPIWQRTSEGSPPEFLLSRPPLRRPEAHADVGIRKYGQEFQQLMAKDIAAFDVMLRERNISNIIVKTP